jgi:hypothetical protein
MTGHLENLTDLARTAHRTQLPHGPTPLQLSTLTIFPGKCGIQPQGSGCLGRVEGLLSRPTERNQDLPIIVLERWFTFRQMADRHSDGEAQKDGQGKQGNEGRRWMSHDGISAQC